MDVSWEKGAFPRGRQPTTRFSVAIAANQRISLTSEDTKRGEIMAASGVLGVTDSSAFGGTVFSGHIFVGFAADGYGDRSLRRKGDSSSCVEVAKSSRKQTGVVHLD